MPRRPGSSPLSPFSPPRTNPAFLRRALQRPSRHRKLWSSPNGQIGRSRSGLRRNRAGGRRKPEKPECSAEPLEDVGRSNVERGRGWADDPRERRHNRSAGRRLGLRKEPEAAGGESRRPSDGMPAGHAQPASMTAGGLPGLAGSLGGTGLTGGRRLGQPERRLSAVWKDAPSHNEKRRRKPAAFANSDRPGLDPAVALRRAAA